MISLTLLPRGIKNRIKDLSGPVVPRHVSRNFRVLTPEKTLLLKDCLVKEGFFPDEYVSTEGGKNDLDDHLSQRLNVFRRMVIPWLNDTKPLRGMKILEIGCGTGSSTVALAEQGANVTGVDISQESLNVAQERCRLYGMSAEFQLVNAADVHTVFSDRKFDAIIFFASLEHMTHEERLSSMHNTWNMLEKGGLWCLIEIPNRLWYFDAHTSRLPFYHWLPDELAYKYSKFSPRDRFNDLPQNMDESSFLNFLRWGRGVSYHEIELAIDRIANLDVASSLFSYLKRTNLFVKLGWGFTIEGRYESFLRAVMPQVHPGFFEKELSLVIRKK